MANTNSPALLGPKSDAWLAEVGVHTRADVARLGALGVYRRVRAVYPDRVSLNLLWALEGLILGIPGRAVPEERKAELREGLGEEGPRRGRGATST